MKLIIWLIISVLLILIWEALGKIVPEGGVWVFINILLTLGTFVIGSYGYLPIFRKSMRGWMAWLCSLVLWFIVFVILRSILFPV